MLDRLEFIAIVLYEYTNIKIPAVSLNSQIIGTLGLLYIKTVIFFAFEERQYDIG